MSLLHNSDSIVQRNIEDKIQPLLEKYLKIILDKGKYVAARNSNPTAFQVDYFNEEAGIFCEVYARIGKLKAGNKRKILSDMLKLLTIEKLLNKNIRKCIVLTDESILKEFQTGSWASKSMKIFDFELIFVELEVEDRIILIETRELQKR